MDLEFDRAASRLKNEQKARLAKEKAKRIQDQIKAEEVKKKQAEIDEQINKKRKEQQAIEEAEQLKKEEEERLTGGVEFQETYKAVSLNGDSDRVTLPVSALNALDFKGAMQQNGPMFFELTTREGGRTHAGVLEFVAEEGTIGLPAKVRNSLAAITEAEETLEGGFNTRVTVKYVRLEKGTSVTLQPRSTNFSTDVFSTEGPSRPTYDPVKGKWVLPGVEGILHSALQPLCALTVGDIVKVHHRDQEHELEVLTLEPKNEVSLIDTNIQVEFSASKAEIEEQERRKVEEEKRVADAERRAQAVAQRSQDAAARLREEPAAGTEGVKTLAIKLPTGERIQRRFLATACLQEVFDLLDAANHVATENYNLCTTYPRRVLDRSKTGETLDGLGLSAQEAILIETGPQ